MIQCKECEFFHPGPDGQIGFRCDPFSTVKEPECLAEALKEARRLLEQQLSGAR